MKVKPKNTKTKIIKNFLNVFSNNKIKKIDKKKNVNGTLFPAMIMLNKISKNKNRVINNVVYPIVVNEIMSGFINSKNYLTTMTLGCLEDISFVVDYNSTYVKNVADNPSDLIINMEPEPEPEPNSDIIALGDS